MEPRLIIAADSQPAIWRRSSACQVNNGCVELARLTSRATGVRDSRHDAASPVLIFGPDKLRDFLTAVKAGVFDLG